VTVRPTPRQCTTFSCPSPTGPTSSCTTMPSSIAFPAESNGVSGCNWLIYTGKACADCNQYCDEDKPCPIGYRTSTTSQVCPTVRCYVPSPLPACSTTPPSFIPYPRTTTSSCDLTVVTGTPCSLCPAFCTMPTAAALSLDLTSRQCSGDIKTVTTEKFCYTTCRYESFPTPCTAKANATVPITETYGCTAYVQTGTKSCPECLPFCTGTSPAPPEPTQITIIHPQA
jgi:hypothetical protein